MKTFCGTLLLMLLAVGAYGQEKPQPIDCKRDLPVALEKALSRIDGHSFSWTSATTWTVMPDTRSKAEQLRAEAADKLRQAEQAERDATELTWLRAVRDKCGEKTLTIYGDTSTGTTISLDKFITLASSDITWSVPASQIPASQDDINKLRQEIRALREQVEALKKPQATSGALDNLQLGAWALIRLRTGWPFNSVPVPVAP